MDAKTFIDRVAAGEANDAKDLINDLLSSRAFEALEVKKIEIAQSLYDNGEEIEVQNTADTPMEDELLTQEEFDALSEEDQELYLEQLEDLDEVSQKTAVKAYSTRLGREDDDTGNTKSMKTMDRIHKKYGAKGVMRAATAADKAHGVHSADYTKKDFVGDYLSSKGNKVKEEVEELDEESVHKKVASYLLKSFGHPMGGPNAQYTDHQLKKGYAKVAPEGTKINSKLVHRHVDDQTGRNFFAQFKMPDHSPEQLAKMSPAQRSAVERMKSHISRDKAK